MTGVSKRVNASNGTGIRAGENDFRWEQNEIRPLSVARQLTWLTSLCFGCLRITAGSILSLRTRRRIGFATRIALVWLVGFTRIMRAGTENPITIALSRSPASLGTEISGGRV